MTDPIYVQPGTYAPGEVPEYAYCEPVTAGSQSKKHIRKVKGKLFLTGGVDTPSLCGYIQPFGPEKGALGGWDVNVKITESNQAFACPQCVDLYLKATRGTYWGECYDCCHQSPMYMVRDPVWIAAWPEYRKLRAELKTKHPDKRVFLLLCFPCLEARLKRKLTINDFDSNIVINHGILLGFEIGLAHAIEQEVRDKGEETQNPVEKRKPGA